jgi:predicted nucleic acid-binding Zn ribbon protein
MQQASAGLAQIMADVLRHAPVDEAVRLAWTMVAGGAVGLRTRPADFSGGVLRVEVPDNVWRTQLTTLERRYVSEIAGLLGKDRVTGIQFFVAK